MRLSEVERRAIDAAIVDVPGEVFLFGSRTDDGKRGGDIDLLVLTDAPAFETSKRVAVEFFKRCEEKIDVVVIDPARPTEEQSAFLRLIRGDLARIR